METSAPPIKRSTPAPAPRAAEIQRIDIEGQVIRVAVWPGPANSTRPPLLIFNGIGVALEFLDPLVEALPDLEIITFDVPGVGESPAPLFPYRLWMIARLADKLLDRLGYREVDVLGASWGGALAQEFAWARRDRCRRLVLAATMQGLPLVPPQPLVLWKFLMQTVQVDPKAKLALAAEVYGGQAATQPEVLRRLAPLKIGANPPGFLLQQLALTGWSSVPRLPFLRQSTLVMAGRQDPLVPLANSQFMAGLIPRSRLEVYDDGHLYLVTNPVAAAATIDAFLAAPDPAA